MTIQGAFFDLYGTLLIAEDAARAWSDWLDAFYESLRGAGLDLSREAFAKQCDGFFSRPEPQVQPDGLTVYERRIRAFTAELGLALVPDAVRSAATASAEAWHRHMALDPDAAPVLTALKGHVTLALVSNFDHPPFVHTLLTKLHLRPYFDAIVISGDVGVKKPDPAIFAVALRQTGLSPADVVFIGDSAEDVHGARAAGLRPILIRRDGPDLHSAIADFRTSYAITHRPGSAPLAAATIATLTKLLEICIHTSAESEERPITNGPV